MPAAFLPESCFPFPLPADLFYRAIRLCVVPIKSFLSQGDSAPLLHLVLEHFILSNSKTAFIDAAKNNGIFPAVLPEYSPGFFLCLASNSRQNDEDMLGLLWSLQLEIGNINK